MLLIEYAVDSSATHSAIETVRTSAWLLLVATLIGMTARRFRVPYAVALVIGGVALHELHVGTLPRLEPDVLFFVFLPPLLFDAAFRLETGRVRALAAPVLLLAVAGVFASALFVGLVCHVSLDLSIASALLLGAMVAATDPIAVVSIFHELKVPDRLAFIVEAESLVNDGMAITLYAVLLDWAVTGKFRTAHSLVTFIEEVGFGIGVGVVTGLVAANITNLIDDHLIEMCLSVSLAYGSYLIADSIGGSGALACVAAGVIHGALGRSSTMRGNVNQTLNDLWEFLGFIANAFVFLLLGLSVRIGELIDNGARIIVAIAAVLVSRLFLTWGIHAVTQERAHGRTSRNEAAILTWGGLRGALTAALALALPADTPHRDQIVAIAFGVVMFTILVQGSTLRVVVRKLTA